MPPEGPPPSRAGEPRAAANEDNLLALGRAIERRPPEDPRRRHVRRRRRRWMTWTAVGMGALAVLVVLAIVAVYIYIGSLVGHTKVDFEQKVTGPSENILLVGSTNRCAPGEKPNPMYGTCEDGVTGINSDIVMIVHLDPNTHKVTLLSIPRDLFEPNARQDAQANKIDASLVEGPSQLAAAVEEDFAIPINHFVELNFDTFANVVNDVGGIDMYFPKRIFDAESSLNIERPGCYHLDGIHALEVVRARHLQIQYSAAADGTNPREWPQEPASDLARIRRTHEFLRVVAAKIASLGIGDPGRDLSLATSVLPDLTVDNQFNEGEMVSLADTYHATKIAGVPQYTYPIVLDAGDASDFGDYIYKGGNYGEVEFPVQPGGWQAVDTIFGASNFESPWNDKPLPHANGFHVSVENGSGVANQQATVATQLGHLGFVVNKTGVRAPVGTTSETVVWYGGPPPPKNGDWVSASQAAALRVLSELGGPVTLGYDPGEVTPGDMVTVQTGSAISVATHDMSAPPTPTPTTTSTSTSTSVTSSTVTTTTAPVTATTVADPPGIVADSNFSKPSALASPLMPWDPRACTPNMPIVNK